ncbi:hypothetical protein [Geobacillus thermoleovorans]|uniref:hypothetical protein n=1 Tax=Geobacillus thermoleovorans TaxID=33941 RepID=UPI003DA2A7A9
MRWFCCRRAEELDHLLREHSSSLDEPLFVQIAGNDEAAVRHAAAALARRWPHASGMEFPFLIERNGRDVCLPIVAVNQDGSVAVRGHVHNGEKVRFAYIHAASLYWSARDASPAIFTERCGGISKRITWKFRRNRENGFCFK